MNTVTRFFNECVDENANKLSLAIAAYVESEWFKTCVSIGAEFDQLIMDPLKEAFFNEKLDMLKNMFKRNVQERSH